jgi:hypothetical protein
MHSMEYWDHQCQLVKVAGWGWAQVGGWRRDNPFIAMSIFHIPWDEGWLAGYERSVWKKLCRGKDKARREPRRDIIPTG